MHSRSIQCILVQYVQVFPVMYNVGARDVLKFYSYRETLGGLINMDT